MTSSAHLLKIPVPNTADDLQNQAADPGQSVWVGASAGSGKTKVLTDRVLRLLLPGPEGEPGTPPERILCLTFTKAGAAEMAVRITGTLAAWAVEKEDRLHDTLSRLLGRAPQPVEMEGARRLFARVIDCEGGLRILTIHSFCQSILGRFPLEAGLPPHFRLIDERNAAELQQQALEHVIRRAGETGTGLGESLRRLSLEKGEGELTVLLSGLIGERQKLRAFAADPAAVYGELCALLGLDPGESEDTLLQSVHGGADHMALRESIRVMAGVNLVTMQKRWPLIQQMLDCAPNDVTVEIYSLYRSAYLKLDRDPIKDLVVSAIRKEHPHIEAILQAEQDRIAVIDDRMRALHCACLSHDLLCLGLAVMEEYQRLKSRMAALDYDDLIARTLDLLTGKTMNMTQGDVAPWVMFKLDQGIDHILVDEAQDTNPDQWAIIHALAGEFFSGDGARGDVERTIFAVGDEKQSIFGFQRAAPEKFHEAEALYHAAASAAGKPFVSVPMTISFRSVAPVLTVTDAVFNAMDPWRALGLPEGAVVSHSSHRAGQAGQVELWPLNDPAPPPETEPWSPPVRVEDRDNPEAFLAKRIAAAIDGWIGREILPDHDRPVRAGDIMILVKSRGSLVDHLVRALKAAKIEVSGVDRMRLSTQIAVQDLLAAARFALLPEDDLTLACLLKSPLIGMTEDDLYTVAIDREGQSLWSALRARRAGPITEWLSGLIAQSGGAHPYEFFSDVLNLPCPGGDSGWKAMMGRLGEDSFDPLEEFLNTALDYEVENIPSLQQFVAWHERSNAEIKREMEGAGDKVRIMTVHGSKGLQAPIVILPDTAHNSAAIAKIGVADRIIWTAAGPLWSPRAAEDCALYRNLLEDKKARLAEEYRRLLYVAMTRAASRLYVTGCIKSPRSKPAPECWHHLVEKGFQSLGDRIERFIADRGDSDLAWRLSCPQTAEPDRRAKADERQTRQPACADWSWITSDPPPEETLPRHLSPSRPSDPEPAMPSPLLQGGRDDRFRRGNITHTLLQFLPGLPPAQRHAAAQHFLDRQQDIAPDIRAGIRAEVFAILEHPDFAPLFAPGSMAEVPITAQLGDTLVSGQIDRLLVSEREIMIVDYKTNRPPPVDDRDIPPAYRAQLRAYRDVLAKIYPGRTIRTFLLWTDGPRMAEIAV